MSTQEQKKHGLSVDSQIVALQEYAEKNGYIVAGIYNDAGISARKRYTKRPALLQMMKDCESSKIDLVLFTKLDRFFRSVADYYEVQTILDKNKIPWRAIWEDYETETSTGVFKVNIMLSVAQAEADRTSERIRSVNEYRKANGQCTYGRAPTGYKSQNSKLIKDPEKIVAVEEGFKAFLKTSLVPAMQDEMKKHGVIVARETISRMLRNPTYYGNAYGIQCDPYITKEKWDRIQYIIDSRKTKRSTLPTRTYLFGGLVKCESCGSGYHSQTRGCPVGKNGKRYHYKYYSCGRGRNGLCENKVSISELKLERYMIDNLEKELDHFIISSIDMNCIDNINYDEERKKIESRIRRIGDRYELGDIERDEYIQKVNILKSELSKLVPAQKKIPEKLPEDWLSIYMDLDDQHKRNFWNQILSNIIIGKSGIKIYF